MPIDYLIFLMKLDQFKSQMVNDMKKLLAALPVFAAALVLAGSASHAFTFENNSASSSNGAGRGLRRAGRPRNSPNVNSFDLVLPTL